MAVTAKDVVINWIENRSKTSTPLFWSYEFEEKVVLYGRLAHQKSHTASTYSRAFRDIRSSDTLSKFGLALEEINGKGKVKGWKINRL
tara:strand:+ start:2191 stop:2454 length:264 start_codon:yes stop_codon:yes gene_type:complete